jgi:outer membrane cobalamin receptor
VKKVILFFLLTQTFFATRLWAEEKADSLKTCYLDGVVVTAKRAEAKLRDCPADVSLVTEKDILTSNANSATDVLAFLPGVFIQRTGGFGRADIDIRGIGSNGRRVSVLIDGKPEKMGLYGCAVTHSLPLNNVQRIEVVRGPASVLYGSDALGGVVNIITKGGKEAQTDYTFSYGSFDTYQNRIRAGASLEKLDFYATADKRKSNGHLTNSAYDGEEYSFEMGYPIAGETRASVLGRYFKGYKEEPLPSEPGTWNDYERTGLDLSLKSEFSSIWNGSATLYHNWGEHVFSDGWHSKDFTSGVSLQMNGQWGDKTETVLGAEWKTCGGKRLSDPPGNWNRDEFSMFAQAEHHLVGNLALSLGTRYTHDQISADNVSSQAGLVLELPTSTLLRASFSQGFRTPGINELYMFPPSNQNLKPERAQNYEVGINQMLISRLSLDLTGFIMQGDHLIELGPNPSPPPGFLFQNTGDFNFKGVEMGLRLEERKLNTQIYYSHLDTEGRTQGRPEDKLSFKARYEMSPAWLSVDGQYVWNYYAGNNHQDRIDEFFVLNSKASYRITDYLNIFLGAENLLDQTYQLYVEMPSASGLYSMPGRSFSAGFQITP